METAVGGQAVTRALSIRDNGFFLAGIDLASIQQISLGPIFTLKDAGLSLGNIDYTEGSNLSASLNLKSTGVDLGISGIASIAISDSNDSDPFALDATYDFDSRRFDMTLDDSILDIFNVFTASTDKDIPVTYNPSLEDSQRIALIQNLAIDIADVISPPPLEVLEIYNDKVVAIQGG